MEITLSEVFYSWSAPVRGSAGHQRCSTCIPNKPWSHNFNNVLPKLTNCITNLKELKKVKDWISWKVGFQSVKKDSEDQQVYWHHHYFIPMPSEPSPVIPPTFSTPFPTSVLKSDHIKWMFPTFGRLYYLLNYHFT